MILLVDLGNSRMKWACWIAGVLQAPEALTYDSDEDFFHRAWAGLGVPDAVYVANVAGGEMAVRLQDWVREQWQCAVKFVKSSRQCAGVTNGYERPEQLGVDRWAAIVAAYQRYPQGVVVVDCGTAVTLDVVEPGGRHLGGLIVPGLGMMRSALQAAAGIGNVVDCGVGPADLGTDTSMAVESGIRCAIQGLLDSACGTWQSKAGDGMSCVLTGGDAERCLPDNTDKAWQIHDDLVLMGVAILAGVTERGME